MKGLTQISLRFWSELLPLPGGGALLAGLCLLGPSRGPGTQDLSGQSEESNAKGMHAVHSPVAGLSPGLFLFPPPCRAEAQGLGTTSALVNHVSGYVLSRLLFSICPVGSGQGVGCGG